MLSRCPLILRLAMPLLLLPLATTAVAARVQYVPNVPDEVCSADAVTQPIPHCSETLFEVKVLPLTNSQGVAIGCLASFLYNHLKVVTGQGKFEARVTWFVDPSAKAEFFGNGILITKRGTGPSPNALFQLPPTIVAGGQSVSVDLKPAIAYGKMFNHLPVVRYIGGGLSLECLGVDPTIGNSAN